MSAQVRGKAKVQRKEQSSIEVESEDVEDSTSTTQIPETGDKDPDRIISDPDVLSFVADTGCPIYSATKLDSSTIASLILTPANVDPDKVCCRVPPCCPGTGTWIFIISLDHVDADDLSCDNLGKWNKPFGKRHFFGKVPGSDELARLLTDRAPAKWDYCVKSVRYTHPGVQDGKFNKFQKYIFVAYNNEDLLLGPYAVVLYDAMVDPATLKKLAKNDGSKYIPSPLGTPKYIPSPFGTVRTTKPTQESRPQISSEKPGMRKVFVPHHSTSPDSKPQSSSRVEWMQLQVMGAKKRKVETETEKLEMEKEKIRLEMQVLRAKKSKLDWETRFHQDQNVVIVAGEQDDVLYDDYQ